MNLVTVSLFMQDGNRPFHVAAEVGSLEIVTQLLDSGADLHVRDEVSNILLSNYILGCTTPSSLSVFD